MHSTTLVARPVFAPRLIFILHRYPFGSSKVLVNDSSTVPPTSSLAQVLEACAHATEARQTPDPWPQERGIPRNIMDMELIATRGILSLAAESTARLTCRIFYEVGRKH